MTVRQKYPTKSKDNMLCLLNRYYQFSTIRNARKYFWNVSLANPHLINTDLEFTLVKCVSMTYMLQAVFLCIGKFLSQIREGEFDNVFIERSLCSTPFVCPHEQD